MSFNDQQHRGEAAGYYDGNNLHLDQEQAIRQARYEKHGREDKEDDDDSLFSKALSFLNNKKDKVGREDIDEQKVVQSHQMLYGDKDDRDEKHGAESLGSGAAMQALKMFMSSSGNQNQSQGGGDQNKLVGMAMAQAGQMWEQKNQQGRVNTDKQTAVNMAAEYALKMYIKGQMGGGSTGAGGLGGLGGLALISSALGGGGGQQQQGGLAALAGALTGGGQQQQQQQQPSGLAAIAGALGGGGGQQQHQQQQQQQNQQQGDGASNLLNMASKFLK
ncbi:TPA_exp: Uncharacterized protein A8136_5523 [Trichophyton benhamiae CBS 112371]|uniref:DUF7721 domain-containing protein n=1 Tax=Arthroderma benhamiae (strain ATCC MYA-4681 / CBS 112371) TaxID=663331 RepID=D4ANQ6_ARTBC|nr:uncharacterized protein ARB_05873 [Trichophyton benhamiae CBS 112371]EFE34917.1 hypothetical protein ARB_05873 [Trichophyton benhamiae CBS 112371]DAA77820.1 TPA_exp: Uncharacterized protein A8136_5523 [Trichophyton benhamiae CBS 112371]